MPMEIAATQVKELRTRTGAGMMDCKTALVEAQGDMDRAVTILRERGMARADRKAGREARRGQVVDYIHTGGQIGVLVELCCETDFVARTEEFQSLARDVAMHVAAMNPTYIRREDVPKEVLEEEQRILRSQAEGSGKPPKIIERIVEGRLEQFFRETCLEDQPFVKDQDRSVGQIIKEAVARIGENIVVRRFCRFQVGEATDQSPERG